MRMRDPVVAQFRQATSMQMNRSGLGSKWKHCKAFALSQMQSCTPYRVSSILYCCNKGSYFDEELFGALLGRALGDEEFLLGFGPVGMSFSVQSLGMLSRLARSESRWEGSAIQKSAKDFAVDLLKTFQKKGVFDQGSVSARNASCTVHGLGLLFQSHDGSPISPEISPFVEALLKVVILRGQNGKVIDIDMPTALFGCARMGFRNHAYIRDICLLVTWRLDHEEPVGLQCLANVVWALGKMEFQDHDILTKLTTAVITPWRLPEFADRALCSILSSLAGLGYENPDVLNPLIDELAKPHRIQRYSNLELGIIVYSFGKVKCLEYILNVLGEELIKDHRLTAMNGRTLSNAIYGFGKANYFNSKVVTPILHEAQGWLSRLPTLELTCLIHGLALMQSGIFYSGSLFDHMPFMEAFSTECKTRVSRLPTRSICNISWAYSQLRYTDKLLLDLLFERYIETSDDEQQFVEEEFGMIVFSCARLNCHNSSFLKFLPVYFEKKLETMETLQVLCNVLWGCAVIGILEKDLFLAACKRINKLTLSGGSVAHQQFGQLAHAWMYLTMIRKYNMEVPDYAKLIIMQAKSECREAVYPYSSSKLEAAVATLLTEAGIPYTAQAAVVDGLLKVDYYIQDCKPPIVIECDGPWHFSFSKEDGSFICCGETVLRNALLESQGFKVGPPSAVLQFVLS